MPKTVIALTTLLFPSLAMAHSGHGHIDAASIWHWLLEFDHIGWLVPAVIVFVLLFRGGSSSRDR